MIQATNVINVINDP